MKIKSEVRISFSRQLVSLFKQMSHEPKIKAASEARNLCHILILLVASYSWKKKEKENM